MIHAGFLFNAASFAAIAAINKPNVVLVVARCNFLAALKVADEVIFEARAMQNTARKRAVTVEGPIGKIKVFDGEFSAGVTDRHTLSLNRIDE
jgi:acyl-coenzyme A thioesterase PaaI-like protein